MFYIMNVIYDIAMRHERKSEQMANSVGDNSVFVNKKHIFCNTEKIIGK